MPGRSCPDRPSDPTMLTSDPGQRPIAVLGVTGTADLPAIARLAEQVLARRLEQIDGVASVAVTGVPEDEIRVELDPARLRALGLTTGDVVQGGEGRQCQRPGWHHPPRSVPVLGPGTDGTAVDRGVRRHPRRARRRRRAGVRLRDVGTVSLASADPRTLTRLDGAPGIGLVVYKDAGANTVAVTQRSEQSVRELGRSSPTCPSWWWPRRPAS